MSFKIVNKRNLPFMQIERELVMREDFTGHEKLAYLTLCAFENHQTGEAYPSYSTIAKKMGVSKPTAIKAIKGLEKKKLIAIVPQKKKKEHYANIYYLLGFENTLTGNLRNI